VDVLVHASPGMDCDVAGLSIFDSAVKGVRRSTLRASVDSQCFHRPGRVGSVF